MTEVRPVCLVRPPLREGATRGLAQLAVLRQDHSIQGPRPPDRGGHVRWALGALSLMAKTTTSASHQPEKDYRVGREHLKAGAFAASIAITMLVLTSCSATTSASISVSPPTDTN